ncbi:DEAD/DEAH box helicase [Candidatus Poribacteria bacterium]|nr:DEAD/DEAH box helicase [Candidatus Poribacteria bacterium]
MNVEAFLNEIRNDPNYAEQIVYVHEAPAREAIYAEIDRNRVFGKNSVSGSNIERLYCHQAEAICLASEGKDVLVATGAASGKTLCYTLPIIEKLQADPQAKALLLFPTKALCQDQFKNFSALLETAGLSDRLAGVFDGDTPSSRRRKLRDKASVVFSNPDMVHASLMSQHSRWAEFLGQLKILVLDELHVYSGIFGSNMALLLRCFFRICKHYGSNPQIIACSATIANPKELSEKLTGRTLHLVDNDGSPRGKKTYVLWNPPRIRATNWRSRLSANVEAHELMAKLIEKEVPTITFSKAKMTAEMIHRYVCEKLQKIAPNLVSKVTPYRGGYLPEDRREIEKRLFNGELMGVSTTPALELGIDVGSLEGCIIVGYPGTRASFFQQSGRAGRKERDSIAFLIGLDTSVNQYIMTHPEYIFEKPIEQAVIDPDNPFVVTQHLRCATHEMALSEEEVNEFGPYAETVLKVLEANLKVKQINGYWYYSASETPQHEVSLRGYADANVIIEEVDTGKVLGEVNKFDSEPILHPEAIYMHLGDTYRVLELDLEKNIARVKREEVDYYTQPLGGTDIHHIDNRLREKDFGTGKAYWGEVTAYFNTGGYEKIHFYSLDAISRHGVNLPTMVLETMAFWIVPPEDLMEEVRRAGLDVYSGLRGIGYATRMLLPLFMTCDTLDFSHTIGSVNSPWNAIFVYERYPHGLGFTEKAYERLYQIMPMVLDNIKKCPCQDGCPCCVGKPLRQFTTWNVERGEASIPNKAAATMILEGLLSSETESETEFFEKARFLSDLRIEAMLQRRLERMREPQVFHPITPEPEIKTEYPAIEKKEELKKNDVTRRAERRIGFDKKLRDLIAKRIESNELAPNVGRPAPPKRMKTQGGVVRPTDFPGQPETSGLSSTDESSAEKRETPGTPVVLGDALAARAQKMYKGKRKKIRR